jgi:acetoin utilization deacetylase AcuC-like enzyme
VLIFDWDVHHGNGTNDIFASDPRVLFVSIHQSPLYPGTGPASDVGSGAGSGFTVNLPVPPGAGDEEFVALTGGVLVPLLRAFSPGLVLISAGYDAHDEDPLADCRVSEAGFAAMAGLVRDAAREDQAPVGAVLEGGYAPAALARSTAVTMDVLAGGEYENVPESGTGEALVAAARDRLRRWWAL